MKTYKDVGIPFKQINLNEADRIISILTKYHGRVDSIAKGIRKITSRKAGNIDLMTLSKFSFAKGKNLDVIIEAELVDNFEAKKKNLKSTFNLFYICELLDKFLNIGESQNELFELLLGFLNNKHSNRKTLLHSFELKLITDQGYEPNLKYCLISGDKFNSDNKKYLSNERLGFICKKTHEASTLVNDNTIKIINFLIKNSITDSLRLKIDKKYENEIKNIIKIWMNIILEKELKSKIFID